MEQRTKRARIVVGALVAGLVALAGSSRAASTAPPKLKDIRLEPAAFSLLPGQTQAMQAFGVYSDGSSRELTGEVVVTSRDAKVATVDGAGLVTAVGSGRTEISATDPVTRVSSRTKPRVTVFELDALSIAPSPLVLRVGDEVPVQALGNYEDGPTGIDLTRSVQWSSAKSAIAAVVLNPDGSVSARGVAPGVTNLIARDDDSGVKTSNSTGKVTVVSKLVGLAISPAKKTVRVGERTRFSATGTFEKGMTVDVSTDVEWITGDPAIATVDEQGRVSGVNPGSTTIKAMDRATGLLSSASAQDAVISVVGEMTALKVSPANTILALGAKANLKASATFAEQTATVNFTGKVEWNTSDPERVAVDRLGVASCLAPGTVSVWARDPVTGITSTATGGDGRVICGVAAVGIEVTPATISLGLGKTKKVKAFLVFEEGTRVDVTKQVAWTSNERRIATVGTVDPNIGLVTAVGDGITDIVATDPVTRLRSSDPGGTSAVVTVQGQPISIQIEPDPGTGIIKGSAGGTLQLKVLAKFAGGSTRGINNLVTWSTSAANVASVSNGEVDKYGFTRLGVPGTATVTITYPPIGTPLPPGATLLTDTVTVLVE